MALNAVKYYKEVKSEMAKVTWPSRKETIMSTIMVFIFVSLTALFLFAADQIISVVVQWILGVGA
ncbi:MAG: preprotein translocase subunit SecE [Rickettsiales bacterium]|nr:preprotein translocase subunit SecE [Rickettsiales bacterium]|tara:strand:+ start:338 stop:532 length:195 start_codon:yes stop_codon:yes gene_type:complete